jgi:hypothetical protein
MPRDHDVFKPLPPGVIPPTARSSFFERMFDEHSDGKFVKMLLIVMLLIATIVQPFSLIYTAYGEHLPDHWWAWTPALAMLLFVALDWTIPPLAYFFATTHKISLKIVLGFMLAIVAFGAFEGYFTATERLVAMRLQDITKHRLAVERADAGVERLKRERDEMKGQQASDRTEMDKRRATLTAQLGAIDTQIAETQAAQKEDKAQHPRNSAIISEGCDKVPYLCKGPKLDAELKRHTEAQATFDRQLGELRLSKRAIEDKLAALSEKDDVKVGEANAAVKAAEIELAKVRGSFEEAVLDSQVYRWAGALHGMSPREVTAEQANRVLDVFAAAVAVSYVVAQALLAISFYGRHRKSFVQATAGFWRASWQRILRSMRAYYARKRRAVYRDREKIVVVPINERTRIVYVPVPPGGPVPPPEEIVTKNPKVANDQQH